MEASRCQRIRQIWRPSLCPQMNEKWNNSHRAQLNTSRDPSKSKETRKIPAEPGRTRERRRKRKRRGSGMGPATLRGDESEKRSPHKGKPLVRELSLDRRRASFSVGENMANRMWQQERERPAYGILTTALPTQPERHGQSCRQGLGAEMWGSESRPRQRIEVGCEKTS